MVWLTSKDRSPEERQAAIECAAAIHQAGIVDVLDSLEQPNGAEKWQLDYGAWSTVYRTLIPLLIDAPRRVAQVVEHLAAGMWESALRQAFMGWCRRDAARIEGVLALCEDGEMPVAAIASALIVGMQDHPATYLDTAIAFANRGRLRMPAIRAMACMSTDDPDSVRLAVHTLGQIALNDAEPISDRAESLTAVIELAHRCRGCFDAEASRIASQMIASGIPEFHRECSSAVIRFGSTLDDGLIAVLLDGMGRLDLGVAGHCKLIDTALYGLLSQGLEQEALRPLEAVLQRGAGKDEFADLESTAHLIAHAPDQLTRIVCRWLLSGDRSLCAAARHLVISTGNQQFAFNFDPKNADWPSGRTAYVARKAVGWLMPHTTAPASFILCLLPGANAQEAEALTELLSDPILINYPSAARAYLDTARAKLPYEARMRVDQVLAKHDAYIAAIEKVGFVPELQPTERQRWIEHQRQSENWAEASAEAESRSVLLSLVSKQTLLYGVTAISYAEGPDGKAQRFESRLATMSYSADNVMGWIYDPWELDYKLRVFRSEKPAT